MAGKGLALGRTQGNGASHGASGLSRGIASEFDRSMKKAGYIDDTPVPVVVMDCDHTIEYLNSAAALLAGTTQAGSIGLKLWDLFDNDACRTGTCFTSRVLREGHGLGGDAVCTVKGRRLPIRTHVTPRFDENNKIIGVVQVIEENTQNAKLSEELSRLTRAALDGKMDERGDAEQFEGRARDVIQEVNQMLDAHAEKLNWYKSIIDAVPFPIHVLDKDMKWVFLNKAFEKLMVDQQIIRDRQEAPGRPCSSAAASICKTQNCGVVQLSTGVGESFFDWHGQDCKQDTTKLFDRQGEHVGYVEVVQDMSYLVQARAYIKAEVDRLDANLTKLAQGDFAFDLNVQKAGKYSALAAAQFSKIGETLARVKQAVEALTRDADSLTKEAAQGNISIRADASKHQGEFRTIIEGLNNAFEAIAQPLLRCVEHLEKLSRGINGERISRVYGGELEQLADGFNKLFRTIDELIADSTLLGQAGAEGKLSIRANADKHQGDFRKIVQGFNSTFDSVVKPMQDATAVLTRLAGGDFTAQVTNKYPGEYELLASTVNTVSDSVRSALAQIGRNVSALKTSAEELNAVSQSMGSNADETATQASVVSAAAEQVSNNVQTVATGADEMSASIKEIAKNTAEATRVATAAVRTAEITNVTISKLGQSSAEIGQVIKVITSIAQQTNLLALNATIEAARAGEAGKGFAVVANEVKELAKETAKATEDISRKIEAIQGDTNGAVSAISQISQVIGQISDIQTTIASAIEEQSATTNEIGRTLAEASKGSADISKNIGGVAEAAHATTVGATDTATSAHSLGKMAAELQTLVSQFRY